MIDQAYYELVVGKGVNELLRLPLRLGAHRVGSLGRGTMRVAGLQGMLHVERGGVAWRDDFGAERWLSSAAAQIGEVEVRIEPLQHDDDFTVTHKDGLNRTAADVIRIVSVEDGLDVGRVGRNDVVLGSDPDCRVRLFSSHVSRQHCLLYRRGERLFVRDLGSKNGTFMNGTRIENAEVYVPALVRVGDVTLRFEAQDAASEVTSVAPSIIGRSTPVRSLLAQIGKLALAEAPVLVCGESGTGKELVAKALHEHSTRRIGPLVAVNCGALAPSLIESELFGHARGAFTGASDRRLGAFVAAHGGTLFLDEIGELPLHLQPMLLRVLEMREVRAVGDDRATPVDVRVVAATHRELRRAVAEGRFREDLFHRLSVLRLNVPPLRERVADILILAQHFARILAPERHIAFSPDAIARLLDHPFPGNVRELKNAIHRALLSTDASVINAIDLDLDPVEPANAPVQMHLGLDALERTALLRALHESKFSASETARRLGVARSTVYRKMAALGIKDPTKAPKP